jgi:hypothetical protein
MSKPQKITAQVLQAWLTDAPGTVAVVDVRDDDRIGVSTAYLSFFFFTSIANWLESGLIHFSLLFITIIIIYYFYFFIYLFIYLFILLVFSGSH